MRPRMRPLMAGRARLHTQPVKPPATIAATGDFVSMPSAIVRVSLAARTATGVASYASPQEGFMVSFINTHFPFGVSLGLLYRLRLIIQ